MCWNTVKTSPISTQITSDDTCDVQKLHWASKIQKNRRYKNETWTFLALVTKLWNVICWIYLCMLLWKSELKKCHVLLFVLYVSIFFNCMSWYCKSTKISKSYMYFHWFSSTTHYVTMNGGKHNQYINLSCHNARIIELMHSTNCTTLLHNNSNR